MVKPKGGRAAPRYHYIRDAAEHKMFAAISRRKPVLKLVVAEPVLKLVVAEPAQFSKADHYIKMLNTVGNRVDNAIALCHR
jgi:hypothetical protein